MTVLLHATWKIRPGRLAETLAVLPGGATLIQKHGGASRSYVATIGGQPQSLVVTVECADLAAYAKYSDSLNADPDWQRFLADHVLGADAKVELLSTALLTQVA